VSVAIVLTDAEPSGLAEMLAGLLEANLLRRPERAGLLATSRIVIEALDAGVTVTVLLLPGRIEISDGIRTERVDLRIGASGPDLLMLSAAPLRLGLPDPLSADGRAVLRRIAAGRVRLSGAVRHPVVLSRFARILSAR
jgi:hypothetical protein